MTILSVEEFREHVTSDLDDDAIGRLLEAAEAVIVRHAGEPGEATEIFDGGRRFYTLDRAAESVESITETWHANEVTLADNDWYLYPSGLVVERLRTGDHYPSWGSAWGSWARVAITYTPADDTAIRVGVQLDLVTLSLNSNPGATAETIGAWMEQKSQSATQTADEWTSILSRLDVGPYMLVVG